MFVSQKRLTQLAAFAILFAKILSAQQTSGSIAGTVKDAQNAFVPAAKVVLTSKEQGFTREYSTGDNGNFLFNPLPPGNYQITIEAPGFKKLERETVKVFANDRIVLPDLIMQVGAVNETVLVEATAVQLQTQGADRSGVITGKQVVDLAVGSRNLLDTVRIIPGIVYTGGLGGIQANGNRGNQNNLTLDGVNNVDTGSNGGTHTNINLDAVAEFRVITNGQPAEFGRSSGAQINLVTKSGSRDFHGTAYWFHRHEGLNANNWRNNADGRQRNLERVNWLGYNVGGPILIPGTRLNKDRNKLFFFFAQEFQRQLVPNDLRNVTVPTALERRGDFSQTRDASGNAVTIRDPLSNSPFPGNIIPENRWSTDGAKILNFYPLPNAAGRDAAYNYQTQVSENFPIRQEVIRGDYNITDNWRTFVRFVKDTRQQNKPYGQWNADYNIPYSQMNFGTPAWSFITNTATVINPTLTNEFIFGISYNKLNIDPVDDTFSRAKLGLGYRMPFPEADKLGLIQNWRFDDGSIGNPPFTGFAGTPFLNYNRIFEWTDNMTKVLGSHTLKGGIYLHKSQKDQTAFTSVNGNVWFNRDSANPGDTNFAFSNALLGNYQRVQQSNVVLNGQYRNWNIEWYGQDSWRVTRNLTIDVGLRFYWIQPQYDAAQQTSSFNPALFDPAARAVLVQRTASGQGLNPVTGQTTPAALIGSIVPTGRGFVNGIYANGMGLESDPNYPQGLIRNRGIHYAPRLGIAYQFMPKTVLRTGGGVFYDRFQGNPVFDMLPNPPSTISPTFYYGNLNELGSAQGTFFPQNVRGFDINGNVPTTFNWNVSIQRELPSSFLLDVAYVASRGLHNLAITDPNRVAFGSAFLPQNQNPSNPGAPRDGNNVLPINLYRPFQGYGETRITCFCASSNYNSLQVGLTRRLSGGLTFGMAYTWSKALGVASGDGDTLHPTNFRSANYSYLGFDRPHVLVFNYVYDLPRLSRLGGALANPVVRAVFDSWTVSGITTLSSGEPEGVGLDIDGLGGSDRNRYFTGSENVAPRVALSGNPSNGPKDVYQWIDTSVFRLPQVGSQGLESAQRIIRRPWINNWDINVFKDIPLGEERRVQLRVEMYNAPNHTQFSDFNRTARMNLNGQITNLPSAVGGGGGRYGFGAVTAARSPRVIQLAAKFYF
ncbi:MAG: carboxypeptidase regulatory-like domain-containing protein [Bryobacteraceae bacterium]|nr:carboxypeptidase regulatory-like domain-containing protein [Bryobacteraceae bacterium]